MAESDNAQKPEESLDSESVRQEMLKVTQKELIEANLRLIQEFEMLERRNRELDWKILREGGNYTVGFWGRTLLISTATILTILIVVVILSLLTQGRVADTLINSFAILAIVMSLITVVFRYYEAKKQEDL